MPDSRLLVFLLLQVFSGASAEDQDLPPSPELLEFLGEWQTEDGAWMGPDELEGSVYTVLGRPGEAGQEDNTDAKYDTAE